MKKTVRNAARIEHQILGSVLRQLREKAGLSQAAVEQALGRHNTWVSRIEAGTRYIDFATLLDFIELVGGDAPEVIHQVKEEVEKYYKSHETVPPLRR